MKYIIISGTFHSDKCILKKSTFVLGLHNKKCSSYSLILEGWISSRCSHLNGDNNESFMKMFYLLILITSLTYICKHFRSWCVLLSVKMEKNYRQKVITLFF